MLSSLKTRNQRKAEWERRFVPCKNHPERRSKRNAYVRGHQLCATCHNHGFHNGPKVKLVLGQEIAEK